MYNEGGNSIILTNSEDPKNDGLFQKKRNKQIIKKVEAWQSFEYVRPLICKKTNQKLVPKINKKTGKVCLRCPKSNYIQWSIPKVVLETKLVVFEHAKKAKRKVKFNKRNKNKGTDQTSTENTKNTDKSENTDK